MHWWSQLWWCQNEGWNSFLFIWLYKTKSSVIGSSLTRVSKPMTHFKNATLQFVLVLAQPFSFWDQSDLNQLHSRHNWGGTFYNRAPQWWCHKTHKTKWSNREMVSIVPPTSIPPIGNFRNTWNKGCVSWRLTPAWRFDNHVNLSWTRWLLAIYLRSDLKMLISIKVDNARLHIPAKSYTSSLADLC